MRARPLRTRVAHPLPPAPAEPQERERPLEVLLARGLEDDQTRLGLHHPLELDLQPLAELGVHKIFTPGATTVEIVDWVREAYRETDKLLQQAGLRG